MGTLSFSNGKPEGHHSPGTPGDGTCAWCGELMRPEHPGCADLGYRGNGVFCSLRCGFQWAVKIKAGIVYRGAR